MMKYGMKKFQPHHMELILVEAWDAFKVSVGNIVRDSFIKKKKLFPLSTLNFSTSLGACVASAQVSSGSKAEDIDVMAHHTVGPIKVQKFRTDDPMVVL